MSPPAVFLQTLFETGEPVVAAPGKYLATGETAMILKTREAAWRRDLPGGMPAFSLAAAEWAAGILYAGCQLTAWREADETMVRAAFSAPTPDASRPEVIYSADLVLCFLPSVTALAERLAAGDVLVRELRRLAGAWPLSAVGMKRPVTPGVSKALKALTAHPGLWSLYVERIVQREAFMEAADPAVRPAAAAVLGIYGDRLAPRLLQTGTGTEAGIRPQSREDKTGAGRG